MAKVNSLCVFCGSRPGDAAAYAGAASALGKTLAARSIELVYGGGSVGLMDIVASAVLEAEGRVYGVIPGFLEEREVGKDDLTELLVVGDMHSRKRKMFDRSDAFAVLPGGLGTLDETMEVLTWKQLRLHAKPIVLLNIDGFWNPMLHLLEQVVAGGFADAKSLDLYQVADSVPHAFELLDDHPEPMELNQPQRF